MLYFKSVFASEHTTPQNHGKFRKNIYMKFCFIVKFLLQINANYYWLQQTIIVRRNSLNHKQFTYQPDAPAMRANPSSHCASISYASSSLSRPE